MYDDHYFGPFADYGKPGNTYIDLDEVLAPAGTYVTAAGFYLRGNRSALQLTCMDASGATQTAQTKFIWDGNNDRHCDYTSYCDTNVALCPEGKVVCGLKLYQYNNRFAAALKWAEPDGRTEDANWVLGGVWNSNYFDGEDGVSGDYTDTDFTTSMPGYVVTGFGITKNGNRLTPKVRLQLRV